MNSGMQKTAWYWIVPDSAIKMPDSAGEVPDTIEGLPDNKQERKIYQYALENM